MSILYIVSSLLLGYFIGSIPVALVLGKTFRGIDIREHGSKNLGATNAGRVLGKKYFYIVTILDAIKCILGMLASYLLYLIFFNSLSREIYTAGISIAGTFAMIGHCYPIFANFRGGKGVATALGYLMFTSPISGLLVVITFIIIVKIKKYVSLGSILGSIIAIIYTWLMFFIFKTNYSLMGFGLELNIWYSFITTIFALTVIFKHKENIKRLINHTENRVNFL